MMIKLSQHESITSGDETITLPDETRLARAPRSLRRVARRLVSDQEASSALPSARGRRHTTALQERTMNKKIGVGDVMKLKSGGVPMTVTDVYQDDPDEVEAVDLVWHDVHGQPCEANQIPIACLVVVVST